MESGESLEVTCPLVTEYATGNIEDRFLRPFPAIKSEVLERLYAIRKWEIDAENNPIPFKWPSYLRTEIHPTGEPLRLRQYQIQAIHHLVRIPRFFFGEAVGLGKTLSTIASFCWLKERFPEAKLIVVTTKSTTQQWADEITRFSHLRPYVMKDSYRGKKSSEARYEQMTHFLNGNKKDALIVKYNSLIGSRKVVEGDKKEKVSQEIKMFSSILREHKQNVVLVFDEAHKFKTVGSQTRALAVYLSSQASRVWALTATAIKNGIEEFYSVANAVGIRPLGTMSDFYENFCLFRKQHIGGGRYKRVLVGYRPEKIQEFKSEMRPFFLGRSQKQVNEPMPCLSTVYHSVELDKTQSKLLLEDIPSGAFTLPPSLVKINGELHEKERDPDNMMTMLSVQSLVSDHWALLDRTSKDFHTNKLSPKEEALLDLLDGDLSGEKVIVFTRYKSHIDRLQWLTENGHFTDRKFLRITGDENETERARNKRLFQDPDSGHNLIVINAAGIEGVNLQQAAHMICINLPWSWGDLIQLCGRMVRMASPHSMCTLHVLVSKGTVDEYVINTLKSKKGVFEAILGSSHSSGLLNNSGEIDLASGMESGDEEEFRFMLRAFAKSVGMGEFLTGDMLTEARNNDEYVPSYEKNAPRKRKFKPMTEDEMGGKASIEFV